VGWRFREGKRSGSAWECTDTLSAVLGGWREERGRSDGMAARPWEGATGGRRRREVEDAPDVWGPSVSEWERGTERGGPREVIWAKLG
jgi:hypothetical protein